MVQFCTTLSKAILNGIVVIVLKWPVFVWKRMKGWESMGLKMHELWNILYVTTYSALSNLNDDVLANSRELLLTVSVSTVVDWSIRYRLNVKVSRMFFTNDIVIRTLGNIKLKRDIWLAAPYRNIIFKQHCSYCFKPKWCMIIDSS